jgi:hypothetical protein
VTASLIAPGTVLVALGFTGGHIGFDVVVRVAVVIIGVSVVQRARTAS